MSNRRIIPCLILVASALKLLSCTNDSNTDTQSVGMDDAVDTIANNINDIVIDALEIDDVAHGTDDTIPSADPDVWKSPFPGCKDGEGCDDLNPCTKSDLCTGGTCIGTPYVCDDGVICTVDSCNGDGGCTHNTFGGACFIDGTCHTDGAANPLDPCQICVSPVTQSSWSPAYGRSCDDQDSCTAGEICMAGKCSHGTIQTCGDNNPCTDDECDPTVGCTNTPNSVPCTDGNPCTMGDECAGGACVSGNTSLPCNDANPCTDDGCTAETGCAYVVNTSPCDDENICTVGDTCADGLCAAGSKQLECVDGNICTDDQCIPETGCSFVPNSSTCNDGNQCTVSDICSGGTCKSGETLKSCDDENTCTDDGCDALIGCTHSYNIDPCDDNDVCTVGDACKGGNCLPGTQPLVCSDGNICTNDTCSSTLGCVFTDNTSPCNDSNICTAQDVCQNGSCAGVPAACDDNSPCTADSCDPSVGCIQAPVSSFACLPKIVITSPTRGANLDGPPSVTITGNVTSGGGKIVVLLINGDAVAVATNGNFSHKMIPKHGMNLIQVEAIDSINSVATTVQAFYYSSEWTPINIDDPVGSYIEEGLQVWLGQKVIDDGVHDATDVDDLATLFELVAASFNLSSLVNGKVGETGGYKIYVNNLKHGKPKVALKPIPGGLHMTMTVPTVSADVTLDCTSITCLFIDLSGTATMQSVVVDVDMLLSVTTATGKVSAVAKNTVVQIEGLDIKINGIVGFLTNWLINFFEGTFTDYIEAAFVDQVATQLPPVVANALESIAFNSQFTIPPFFGSGKSVILTLTSALSSLVFKIEGGTLGLFAAILTQKIQSHPTKGAIGRANCLTGVTESFVFPTAFPLQIALHDDLVNELLFSIWWANALAFPVDPTLLSGVDLNKYGISDLTLTVDFMMPPITTSCNPPQKVKIQIGDIFLKASLKLASIPLEMDIFASIEADAKFAVSQTPSGPELGIVIQGITDVTTDIIFADENLLGFKDTVLGLIENQLIPAFVNALVGGALAGFPLPAIDLGFAPGVPAGTKLELDLQTVTRNGGFTLLQGDVK